MKNSNVQQLNVTSARQNLVLLLKTKDATMS
ncbi:hypothetical protein IWT30_02106 [Secundilactobacillus mixtipabuli]|uniref:Uncharacterized protein n=1 Tax=Secundilactobacillus mixtipabuli TaxID=1435342 RepID=A0A1Z5IEL1_9LACO|nr:hypothetical protein IWT30_02106 [Secundilactobacillus mixtipabuli]